uniref:Uncharacterized protein n=1 Tax=Anguilla anguilla TaxID=7936 RepID=A0A0E9T4U6_ANGAN
MPSALPAGVEVTVLTAFRTIQGWGVSCTALPDPAERVDREVHCGMQQNRK